MSSQSNRIIKNTAWLYAKVFITGFISLWITRLILNALGKNDFGIYTTVGGAIAMLTFLNASMAAVTQRFLNYAEGEGKSEKVKQVFNISIVFHTIVALVIACFFILGYFFFFYGILNIPTERIFAAKIVYSCLVISTIFSILTAPYDAVINAHENMRYFTLIGISESLLKLAVAFTCVHATGDKLIVYGGLMALIPIILLSVMRIYCHRHYEECTLHLRKYWNAPTAKEMFFFGGWNIVNTTTSMLGNYGLGIILNHFFGAILNAALGIATQLTGMVLIFSNNLQKAVSPVLTKNKGRGEEQKMLQLTTSGTKISFYVLSLLVLPAIFEMPYILRLWLKEVPEWAVLFSRLHLLRYLIEQITVLFITTLYADGRIKKMSIVFLFINLLPAVCCYFAFQNNASPTWLYIITISIFGILTNAIRVYFMKHNCGMPYRFFLQEILLPLVLVPSITSILVYSITQQWQESFSRFIFVLCTTVVIQLCLIWLGGLSAREKQLVLTIIKKIRKQN